METTTIFGEFIQTRTTQFNRDGYKLLVHKIVDGREVSSYPAKSRGEAIRIAKNLVS